MAITPEALVDRVQVNIPFPFLINGHLSRFLDKGLNPEIGLDAWSLGTYPLAASRRRLRQAWRWLPVFRPGAVVCHLGYESRHYSWDLESWIDRTAATFRELGVRAATYGVRLTLENVYEKDPEIIQNVIRSIDLDNVQLCLDVGHLNCFGGGDFEGWLAILWPFIGHLHLHDNQGALDDHQALGTGSVPLPYILNFLAEKGRQPLITLEPHHEGSLAPSLQYLADIWPWE